MAAEDSKTYPVLTRRQVEGLIAEGRKVFVLDQHVVKADAWIPYHPGGDKSIMHMIGRDATDEVTAIHSAEAKQRMAKYRIGRIEGRWSNFVPPVQGGKFRHLLNDTTTEDGSNDGSNEDSCPETPISNLSSRTSSYIQSQAQSPLFDTEGEQTLLRNRRAARGLPSSASASSLSSDDPVDGMAYLDSQTREKISLDLDQYPSLDFTTQDEIVKEYRALGETIKAAGLYKCHYSAYAIECTRYATLFGLMLLFLNWGWYILSAIFMGMFWHQLVFTAHDAGHMGITHNFHIDTLLGIVAADFFGGLSLGWWKYNHNVHHVVTNLPEHDPDIEHMPFLAVSHRLLMSLRSTFYDRVMAYDGAAKFFLSIQKYSFYPVMLMGRFNLYRLSWMYLILGTGPRKGPAWWHRYVEIAGHVFFWTWYGYGILYLLIPDNWHRLVFFIVSHIVQAPVHLQITLSHFAMSTSDLGPHESFPQKMLRTTMDVDCPQWLDFFHGGLQFQAVHHLYPRIPRHNLRRTQRLVQDFCSDVGIPYALYGFIDGNHQVIGRLDEVSRQAAILAKCQEAMMRSGPSLHTH